MNDDPTIEHEEDEGEDCVCDKCFKRWRIKTYGVQV